MKDDNTIEIKISDSFVPFVPGHDIAGLTDTVCAASMPQCVAALIEKDKMILVELADDSYHLPNGKVAPGETPKDALFRILRTEYNTECVIGDEVDAIVAGVQRFVKDSKCYRATMKDQCYNGPLEWISLD